MRGSRLLVSQTGVLDVGRDNRPPGGTFLFSLESIAMLSPKLGQLLEPPAFASFLKPDEPGAVFWGKSVNVIACAVESSCIIIGLGNSGVKIYDD
jgi:hypothetical protein